MSIFEELRDSLREVVLDKESLKSLRKEEKKQAKSDKKEAKLFVKSADEDSDNSSKAGSSRRVYVINFKGNIAADAVVCLREEISNSLSCHSR